MIFLVKLSKNWRTSASVGVDPVFDLDEILVHQDLLVSNVLLHQQSGFASLADDDRDCGHDNSGRGADDRLLQPNG
jgi:hypothetical protein